LTLLISPPAWAQVAGAAHPKTTLNPKDGLTYVWIAPGTFQMGCSPGDTACSDDEKPAHQVTLTKGFWISQTLVTNAAYKKVVGSSPSHYPGDQFPVSQVNWDDAQAYCKAADMRLPTEAEWEYAARGGNPSARYGPLDDIAWYAANSNNTTHDVKQKLPNGYGLYDMLGNVWEWVADWYGPYDATSQVDPPGPATGDGEHRVVRGAIWTSIGLGVRVSYRDRVVPTERYPTAPRRSIGFRCAGDENSGK